MSSQSGEIYNQLLFRRRAGDIPLQFSIKIDKQYPVLIYLGNVNF